MNSKNKMLLLISFLLSLMMVKHYFRTRRANELKLSDWFLPRLSGNYLEPFLQSASRFFMPGHRVIFYVISDTYPHVPRLERSPLHSFQVLLMGEERWWRDPDLMCMKSLGDHLAVHIHKEVDFLFSMTPNLFFEAEFGVETLGSSVALIHAWWYFRDTKNVPYERKSQSTAYIPFGQGDFFYGSSIVGGTPYNVLDLVDEYLKGFFQDTGNGINSTYEKYLNKYFFRNKPAKLLSPEYSWDPRFKLPTQVRFVKISYYPRVEF
ncbi:putative glycosyltransferase 6 domain-containing protein 1 isoform 2-T2 [Thomomys bottae]